MLLRELQITKHRYPKLNMQKHRNWRERERWVAHMREEARQTAARESDRPQKPGRLKIPTFCSATPGRRLPATVVPLPACPRTAALRLGLCPSSHEFHRSPSCSPVLTYLHSIAIFSLHTKQALCSNYVFFCLSHPEPSQELSFLSLMMMGSSSSLPFVHCASHSTSSSTQMQERLEKWFYSMVDEFVWGEVSCQ